MLDGLGCILGNQMQHSMRYMITSPSSWDHCIAVLLARKITYLNIDPKDISCLLYLTAVSQQPMLQVHCSS